MRNITILLFLALACLTGYAIPAIQTPLTITDADGATLTVFLRGDESFHQYLSEDGYPLIERNGNFYYCDIDNKGTITDSGIKATDINARSNNAREYLAKIDRSTLDRRLRLSAAEVEKRWIGANGVIDDQNVGPRRAASNDGPPYPKGYGLFSSTHFPAYGNQKALVILVQYQDVKFNTKYDAKDYFTRMLNEDDFSDYGATGSAAQYFRENSLGAFTPEFDVFGPITLAYNQSYYGGNDYYGTDKNPAAMVKEACDQLDSQINFKDYDRDGDGVVDNIFIFYAGLGEATGGGSNTVWPHSWDMVSAGYRNLKYDGVTVKTYGCTNEWIQYNGKNRPDGVGTFIHEFSHVMGLPDLYATSYTSAFTPGAWSALDYGPYNNDGMTPPNYGAFERYALGWGQPLELTRAMTVSLPEIIENEFGIIPSSKVTEYFLVENRQQTGWDKYIPHHGMLIWHIDYNTNVWNQNTVNNNASHQYVDIEEADGRQTQNTITGDPFPGFSQRTSFTAETTPSMTTWSGVKLNYPITDITETDGIITFDVLGGGIVPLSMLTIFEPTDVGPESFTLSWSAPAKDSSVFLSVFSLDENGDPQYLGVYEDYNVGVETSALIEGAVSETTYYYTVYQANSLTRSEASEAKSVTTTRYPISHYQVEATEATDIEEHSFVAHWLALPEAIGYTLTVTERRPDGPIPYAVGFDNGVADIEDWTVTGSVSPYSSSVEGFAGEAVPALRMDAGATLTSPEFDDNIKTFSFWHRGNTTSDGDMIEIYAVSADDESPVLVAEVPVSRENGGTVTTISTAELPSGTLQLSLKFNRTGNKGFLLVDDLSIGHGVNYVDMLLAGYEEMEVGDVLSYTVTGLMQNTTYFYTVKATDGELYSIASLPILLTTQLSTGITDVPLPYDLYSVIGRTIVCAEENEIAVYNLAGLCLGRGYGRVAVPSAGLYIVLIDGNPFKVLVK